MAEINLFFIPSPGAGHLTSTIEIAKILLARDDRLSITFLIINNPSLPVTPITSSMLYDRLSFLEVPNEESDSPGFLSFISSKKPVVKKMISEWKDAQSASGLHLAGLVVDMFFTSMIDVADELGVPCYVYFTANASFLALLLHVQKICDEEGLDVADFKDSDVEFSLPGFSNLVPARLLPSPAFHRENGISAAFNSMAREFRRTKGILVNSFMELESHAVQSMGLDRSIPAIYPVGPVVNMNNQAEFIKPNQETMIMEWLDSNPPGSVVFLCFGSMGAFGPVQVKEMARGIESTGCRFLWSLRRRSSSKMLFAPLNDYEDFSEVLPEGFLERTAGTGKVIGWAPQARVLNHPAVSGFVTHCGWNSVLESLWFGVPIATWPLYAEQQLNAFWLVKEMGIAVEISLDYRIDMFNPDSEEGMIVSGQDIERGIKSLMEEENGMRKKVKMIMEKCRAAVEVGGSSYTYQQRFIDDLRNNVHL